MVLNVKCVHYERFHFNILNLYLKKVSKQTNPTTKPRASRSKEILKIREEINEIENRKVIKK